jgi:hypothetical protein
MSHVSQKGTVPPRNSAICQFQLDRIEYGELDICQTMFPQLVAEACRELLGENWRQIITFDDEWGSE